MAKKKKKNRYGDVVDGKLVIDVNKIHRDNADHSVTFRTGRYMTEKDRPRRKRWSVDDY